MTIKEKENIFSFILDRSLLENDTMQYKLFFTIHLMAIGLILTRGKYFHLNGTAKRFNFNCINATVQCANISGDRYFVGYQQAPSEALLRFPFVNFLASPCDAALKALDDFPEALLTNLPSDLRPFAVHLLPLRSVQSNSARNAMRPLQDAIIRDIYSNITDEKMTAMAHELHLDVLQARQMSRLIYSPSVNHCNCLIYIPQLIFSIYH